MLRCRVTRRKSFQQVASQRKIYLRIKWNSNSFFFFFLAVLHTCKILVSSPGLEPWATALKAPSSNHWTSREFPQSYISSHSSGKSFQSLSFLLSQYCLCMSGVFSLSFIRDQGAFNFERLCIIIQDVYVAMDSFCYPHLYWYNNLFRCSHKSTLKGTEFLSQLLTSI